MNSRKKTIHEGEDDTDRTFHSKIKTDSDSTISDEIKPSSYTSLKKNFTFCECFYYFLRQIWSIKFCYIFFSFLVITLTGFSIWGVQYLFSYDSIITNSLRTSTGIINYTHINTCNAFKRLENRLVLMDTKFTSFYTDLNYDIQGELEASHANMTKRDIIIRTLDKPFRNFFGSMMLGFDDGNLIMLQNSLDSAMRILFIWRTKYGDYQHKNSAWYIHNGREFEYLSGKYNVTYDARDRTWYIDGNELTTKDQIEWSDPYLTANDYVWIQVYKKLHYGNQTRGVMGIAVDINVFSSHLKEFVGTENNYLYVLRDDGLLLASTKTDVYSTIDSIFYNNASVITVLKLHQNPNDKIAREIGKEILKKYGDYKYMPKKVEFRLFDDKFQIHIVKSKLHFEGFEMYVILAEKLSKTLGVFHIATTFSLFFTILVIVVLVLIAVVSSLVINIPINRLSTVMDRISRLELRKTEINVLNFLKLREFNEIEKSIGKLKNGLSNHMKYLPVELLQKCYLNKEVELQVKLKYMTIMFVNIINFVSISETLIPALLVQFLENFFMEMDKIIKRNDGLIDKYIGGTIMILFNAFNNSVVHEKNAVLTAIEMEEAVKKMKIPYTKNDMNKCKPSASIVFSNNNDSIHIRVGINSGQVLVGNIGFWSQMSFTAIGDVVNCCSRIEKLNNTYKTTILMGDSTYLKTNNSFVCRWVDNICLRGKAVKANIWEVIGRFDETPIEIKEECEKLVEVKAALEKNDAKKAKNVLKDIIENNDLNYAARELYEKLFD